MVSSAGDAQRNQRPVLGTGIEIATYDVFAKQRFGGNQAAVVRCCNDSLSNSQLVTLAAELSLAETALSVLHGDELRFRFATADRVVQRCGHASLAGVADHVFARESLRYEVGHEWSGQYRVGSAVARWKAWFGHVSGRKPNANSGIEVAISWPDRPKPVRSLSASAVYRALGLSPAECPRDLSPWIYDSGNRNALVPVRNLAALTRAKRDCVRMEALFAEHKLTDLHLYCLIGQTRLRGPVRLRCRNLFTYGVFEETATGTASVALATFLADQMLRLRADADPIDFLFDQGKGKRRGKLCVKWCPEPNGNATIWLQGQVFPVIRGHLVAIPR
jgi:PhzF family phenazine biosynthesis protein